MSINNINSLFIIVNDHKTQDSATKLHMVRHIENASFSSNDGERRFGWEFKTECGIIAHNMHNLLLNGILGSYYHICEKFIVAAFPNSYEKKRNVYLNDSDMEE